MRSSLSNLIKKPLCAELGFEPFRLERFNLSVQEGPASAGASDAGGSARPIAESAGRNPSLLDESFSAEAGQLDRERKAIVESARAEAERILKRAKEEGFQLGKREGLEAARAEALEAAKREVRPVVEAFRRAAEEICSLRERIMKEAEGDVVSLAIGVAELILQQPVKADPQVVVAQIRKAISVLGDEDEVVVKLNPVDLKVAKSHIGSVLPASNPMKLSLVPDKSVDRGGCVLECKRGMVDARIATQLDRAKAALLQALESSEPKRSGSGQQQEAGDEA